MAGKIMECLRELRPATNRKLNPKIVSRLQDHDVPNKLIKREIVANGSWVVKPRVPAEALIDESKHNSKRKVRTLGYGSASHLLPLLNVELSGGQEYPVLTALLGAASGPVSGGGALLFSAATVGIDIAKPDHRILARKGDEIWHVEEIGKVLQNGRCVPVYVSSFFVVDPYRAHFSPKGWLIHEERQNLTL